jgi:adenylate kinase
MTNIVLFGPPGAGKGTQSEKIIDKYGFVHIATGDLFREHLRQGTELGNKARNYMDNGLLVPDELVIEMVEQKMNDNQGVVGFIFDGFPRTVKQAEALDEMLHKHQTKIDATIFLEVDEEELKKRIQLRSKTSGRTDDQDMEKINKRIEVYKKETLPVAEYYEKQGKVFYVKGVGTIDQIFSDICGVIDSKINS